MGGQSDEERGSVVQTNTNEKNTKYIVYFHICRITGEIYIGKAKGSMNQRSGKDGKRYKGCPKIYERIIEHGWNNFDHFIYGTYDTEKEAYEKERELVRLYKSIDSKMILNCNDGGEGGQSGVKHSEEDRQRESKQRKGINFHGDWSEEQKNIHSETMKEYYKTHEPSRQKKVRCVETGIVYPSGHEAARSIGIPNAATKILACCRGIRKTSCGFHWEFA